MKDDPQRTQILRISGAKTRHAARPRETRDSTARFDTSSAVAGPDTKKHLYLVLLNPSTPSTS